MPPQGARAYIQAWHVDPKYPLLQVLHVELETQ
jgi:hypothetical protein